ncbi:hypothetical protein SAMN05216297_102142 [Flavobacterium phragmitis]|uniref:Uncharacterized protein n=1 Tax=Flavobacterium phragmitis TaxID=739143 RepID=A0A1I1LXP7_9FLAO|nr:hypothetical protein SAMN05216297_102142 [Flavobacterium phragmitis]
MEYEKKNYAPEGLGKDADEQENLLFAENDWEK